MHFLKLAFLTIGITGLVAGADVVIPTNTSDVTGLFKLECNLSNDVSQLGSSTLQRANLEPKEETLSSCTSASPYLITFSNH